MKTTTIRLAQRVALLAVATCLAILPPAPCMGKLAGTATGAAATSATVHADKPSTGNLEMLLAPDAPRTTSGSAARRAGSRPGRITSASVMRGGERIPLRPEMLTAKPLAIIVPEAYETTLTNGIHFFCCESHELPVFHCTVMIRAGSLLDPPDKLGLASVVAGAVRGGGTSQMSPDEFDRELEKIGSEISVSADREMVRVQLFALAERRAEAMKLLAQLLLCPAFDAKKVEQEKDRLVEEIRRENDEPAGLSRREYRKFVYGTTHPLARTARPAHVRAIVREDVKAFYENYYCPSSAWIGIAGDVAKADAQKLVEDWFGAWTRPAATLPAVPPPDEAADRATKVGFILKDTAQAQIRVGHLGVPHNTRDQYAIAVLNGIYGTAGFSSRLMDEIRTRRGYVYGVGGGVFSDDPRGLFVAVGSSKSKSTVAAIEAMIEITRGMLKGDITRDEMELARKDVVNTYISGIDTPRGLLNEYMYRDFLGYPADYVRRYPERIAAVTLDEVTSAARRHMRPDNLKILVVGKPDSFDKPLKTLGDPVEVKLEPFKDPKESR